MRKILIATPLLALAVAACSETANYQSQTEDFINGDEVEGQLGAEVDEATCEEPESTDVGTTYTCTAQVEGVGEQEFVATITDENRFEVTLP